MSLYTAKAMMDPLQHEAQEIARRRVRLEERKPRVLHAKTRLIGIDTEALTQMSKERQERERHEVERDMYYDNMANSYAKTLTEMESVRQVEERKRNVELSRFREVQEQEKRQHQMVQEMIADNYKNVDTNFLDFRGEDMHRPDRVAAQQAQQMDWLNSQVDTLMNKEAAEREYEAGYEHYQRQINDGRKAVEEEAEAFRRQQERERLRYNQRLAVEKTANDTRRKQKDEELSQIEVAATLDGDLLNERVLNTQREGFKGYTASQRLAVLEEQQRQIAALQEKRKMEATRDANWNQYSEDVRRALVLKDRQAQALRAQRAHSLRKEQEKQQKERQLKYDYLDNVVYTNPVKESYFEQFGQSAR